VNTHTASSSSNNCDQLYTGNRQQTTSGTRNPYSCPFAKIKFKDFSRTFKDHTNDIQGELN